MGKGDANTHLYHRVANECRRKSAIKEPELENEVITRRGNAIRREFTHYCREFYTKEGVCRSFLERID